MERHNLTIEYVPIGTLRANPDNPRTHSRKQTRQLVQSIRRFGFTNPLLVGEDGMVIAGHGRLEAAEIFGLSIVPVVRLSGLTEAEQRALMIADNRLAENSDWDPDLLKKVLQGLVDLNFEVEDVGFDTADIDLFLGNDADEAEADEADEVEEPDCSRASVSRPGDLFRLGGHRLLCADARDPASYPRLLGDARAGMVFADPPFNVPVLGHVMGRGAIRHREFEMASGEMSESEFIAFLRTIAANLRRYSEDGAIHFICMDWRHIYELLTATRDIYAFKNLCVWMKDNGGLGSLYRSQHELVAVFKGGTAPHVNNVELGRKGRYRTNVWRYPGVNTFRRGRLADLKAHPTVKPVALVADAIRDCSRVGAWILDPFVGSGTTILACERTQRRAVAMEIDPHYVDTAIARFRQRTGIAAIHDSSGMTFEALATARSAGTEAKL